MGRYAAKDHMIKASILFTARSLAIGGAENQMLLLIRGLLARGHKCEVAALDASGPLRQQLDELKVCVHDLGYHANSPVLLRLLQLIWSLPRLWWLAARRKPDVLQAYLPLTNFIGALAGRLAGIKLVITCRRGLGTHQDRHPIWPLFDRTSNWLSHIVTVNSEAVGSDTIRRDGIARDKIVLIRNGLDFAAYDDRALGASQIRAELGLDDDAIGILCVGNLIPYKGYADLLQAISKMAPTQRAVRFYIAGRNDGIGTELRQQMADLKISESKVVWLGPRRDVPKLMAAMDLYVIPSHEEGFSNALLEAMAAGLPIIATKVGGNPEALQQGRYGTLIAPHDPDALAAELTIMLATIDAANKIGRDAARHVRQTYAADAMVSTYAELYQRS